MKVLEAPAPQSSRRPSFDHEWADDGEIDLYGGVLFFWRFRVLIVVITLVAAALGLLVALAMPKQFTGTATIFLNTPRTQNPLAPDALTVEAVDRLANSELVLTQVGAELAKLSAGAQAGRVTDFRTVLYKSTEPQKPYLPLLGLTAIATSAELSRSAADLWASTLLAETRKLTAATRASAVDFIVNEYPKAAERLNEQERHLEVLKRDHGQALTSTKTSAAVSLREAQLWSREYVIVDLEEQRNRLTVELKAAEATVAALEQELKAIPAVIEVTKAISDDALWDAAGRGGKPLAPVTDARLRTQQINPVHTELTQRLAESRVRRSELAARRPALDAQIEASRKEAAGARAALGSGELSIANLELRQETEVAAKEREVESARANFKKLEERIGDAQIVKADNDSSLTMGARAELPGGPSGPSVPRAVGLAGLGGFLLALVAAWISDRSRKTATA